MAASSQKTQKTNTPDDKKYISIPVPSKITGTHILVAVLIFFSFWIGVLTTRVWYLEKGTTLGADTTAVTPAPAAPGAADTTPKEVAFDDDPVLGDPDAPVTIVEFSDYECPFCKRHHDETYAQLKSEYIDTGKVKLVFRDMPLSFHDPLATKEAMAANCAREQGDDSTYFQFHDKLFETTTSNGSGMTEDQLFGIATELGLNADQLKECVTAEKYKEEITKDIADGTAVGANATPSFFVGKSEDGKMTGTPLIGAQPFAAFKTLIDQNLE